MNYRIETKPAMVLTGYKRHFSGTPADRYDQEGAFYESTRINQYILQGLAHDCDTYYNVMTNFSDDGYDFYIASLVPMRMRDFMRMKLYEETKQFDFIELPEQTYLICETDHVRKPVGLFMDLRRQAVSEWLPSTDYELSDAPEISVGHWYHDGREDERYYELWIPIVKKPV